VPGGFTGATAAIFAGDWAGMYYEWGVLAHCVPNDKKGGRAFKTVGIMEMILPASPLV